MILQAFGIVDVSPIQISQVLQNLRMSHTMLGGQWKTIQYDIDSLSHEQPVWPVVIEKVKNLSRVQGDRSPSVYFVCDGRAALNFTNLNQTLWPENRPISLYESIREALITSFEKPLDADWKLMTNEPDIAEYVRAAVKPSFLNRIQALFHKITPYAKSKETRNLCVAYLAGGIGILALRRYLRSSLKYNDLLMLMDSPAAVNLRNAVASLKTRSIESVAEEFGVENFELLYVVKSYEQHRTDGK